MLRTIWLALCLAANVPASLAAGAAPSILVYGDSLSAAYGIRQGAGWVALLQERLRQKHLDYTVVNASISGETTSGGAARIAATLEQVKPAVVILALGANDGLRGLPVKQMRDNLARIVSAAQRRQSKVVIAGIRMPPNYGAPYTEQFRSAFPDLARQTRSALIPFLLDGIVQRPELFQQDNLHPTEEAQRIILDNVWKALQPILK